MAKQRETAKTLTREEVREFDRCAMEEYGVPGIILMENAARGTVDVMESLGFNGPVVICCGTGNNGGDGFAMARHLQRRGCQVAVWVLGDLARVTGDAAINLSILQIAGPVPRRYDADRPDPLREDLQQAGWAVDAILGTGATGDPRHPMDTVIQLMNDSPARKLAVDIPSGVDGDTGRVSPLAIRADHTCTFVAAKPGMLIESARDSVGQLHVVGIGAPESLRERFGLLPLP